MQPGPTAWRALRSTEELEIINFGHPSNHRPLRTLLSFCDRTPSKNSKIHTYHSRFIPKGYKRHLRYFSETPTLYQNYLVMRNTADVRGSKPIAVWSQSISGVSAINSLVAFYDIHGRKREVIVFYFVLDTTRDYTPWLCTYSRKLKFAFSEICMSGSSIQIL
jgi:hypothetical protein